MAMPTQPKNPWNSSETDAPATSAADPSTAPDLGAGLEASAQQPASWRDTAAPSVADADSSIESLAARASKGLDRMADVVRGTSDRLRASGDKVALYARQAAARLDHVAEAVPQTHVDDVVAGVRRFVRQHPALVVGGAVGLCMIGALLVRNAKVAHAVTAASTGPRPM